MRPWRFFLAIVLALCSSARADITDCLEATCRIEAAGHSGTGCLFATDETNAFILTNAHVAGSPGTLLRCVFIRSGFPQEVSAKTHLSVMHGGMGADLARAYSPDCAIVTVALSEFRGSVPKAIPLDSSVRLTADTPVVSVGCAQGANPTAWQGHVQEAHDWNMTFYPPPHSGRSGSAIFDREGTRIVGLIAWNGGGVGIAQQAHAVAGAFNQKYPDVAIPVCGGGSNRGPTGRFGSTPTQTAPHCPDCPQSDGPSLGGPTSRVPLDELGPTAPPLVPTQTAPPCEKFDEDALVRRIEVLIDAKIAAIPKPVDGKDGAPGRDGKDGAGATVDTDAIVAAVLAKLPKCPTADEIASKIKIPESLTREQIVAIVKEHCNTNKPVPEPERPATRYGYEIVPLPESK